VKDDVIGCRIYVGIVLFPLFAIYMNFNRAIVFGVANFDFSIFKIRSTIGVEVTLLYYGNLFSGGRY
jgi:hypothetical protein